MVLGEQFVAFVCKTKDGDVFRNSLTLWTCGLQGNKLFGLGPLLTIFSNYEKCYFYMLHAFLFVQPQLAEEGRPFFHSLRLRVTEPLELGLGSSPMRAGISTD